MEDELFSRNLQGSLRELEKQGFSGVIKDEQRDAVKQLVNGGNVLAVLPTGFGKSFIFQLFLKVKEKITAEKCSALVITPLRSIVDDQIREAVGLGLTAASLADAKPEDISFGKYQLVFASAEDALDKSFLKMLKGPSSEFHKQLSAIIIDESHTVETWTGKRTSKATGKGRGKDKAFREAFGKLAKLRSFCKEGIPVAALTGTADAVTQSVIRKELCLKQDVLCLYVSPNRVNLRFSVNKVKKEDMNVNLMWLVRMLREKKNLCPKTIIFCNTINEITNVVNNLIYFLGSEAWCPVGSRKQEHSLIGIYHSTSWKSTKERVVSSFKENGNQGNIRVAVATSAFSMGVNFPDVRYIVNWGPARTLLDQHQEAGRAGRDGKQSHFYILYYGQQTSHCGQEVRDFVKSEGCLRKAAYKTLDDSVQAVVPLHNCCSHCTKLCKCDGNKCSADLPPFEQMPSKDISNQRSRTLSEEDKENLKKALTEVLEDVNSSQGVLFNNVSASGFSEQLVEDIVSNCDKSFTVLDITDNFPVFSLTNAIRILEVIQEVFLDIPNFDDMVFFWEHVPIQDTNFDDSDFGHCNPCDDVSDLLSDLDIYSDSTSEQEDNV